MFRPGRGLYVEGLYTDAALMKDLNALFASVNNQDYIAKRRENSLNSDSEIRYVPADIKKLFLDGRTKICGVTLRSDNGIKALRMTNYDLWVDFECRTIEDVKTIPGFGDIMASSYSVRDPNNHEYFNGNDGFLDQHWRIFMRSMMRSMLPGGFSMQMGICLPQQDEPTAGSRAVPGGPAGGAV